MGNAGASSAEATWTGFASRPGWFSRVDGFPIAPISPPTRPGSVRAPQFEFVQAGHGQRESPAMRMENISEGYLHDLYIYGGGAWLAKHKRYAREEAHALLSATGGANLGELISRNPHRRRRALKRLSFGLPFRSSLRFAYQYGLRLGFLDGRQGLRYCRLLARYEGFISDEIKRLKATRLTLPLQPISPDQRCHFSLPTPSR